MSVAEAQARISAREFAEWMAYYVREPWGGDRDDNAAAIIAATVANSSGRAPRVFKPADFLPKYGPTKRQSIQEMQARIMMYAKVSEQVKTKAPAKGKRQ